MNIGVRPHKEFTKEIPADAIDESDTLINDAISAALSIGNENPFEEDSAPINSKR